MKEKNNQVLVSTIIIFFNAGEFLKEAVESVFAQTYNVWELLLVDDGSTDISTAIAQQYARQDKNRVCYLEHEGHLNLGMSASRNLGIRHAQGKYVAFLDADDVWLSETIEQQVDILESQPEAGMVYGPIQYWYSWTGKTEDQERDYIEELGVPANKLFQPPVLLPLFLENKAAVPSGIMVRRQVIENVGGFEDAFRGQYEDQVFCAKVCLTVPVYAAEQCWYYYRQHANSCVSKGQGTQQSHLARLFFLNWLASYLSEQKITDRRIWLALNREFWRYRRPTIFRWSKRWQQLSKSMGKRLKVMSSIRN